MARQGRFGRLPRRAPDLTGAIVAMMREYWNTQENIMVSAWKDGGEVDGKPVTDERLLQFWLDRRDSVQQDDPLWDYYNQQHDQYKFAIEESKVGLQYAQHKMSAREVAHWYKGQADQFAQNSEMWRTVMGQAAKFLDAAKAQARASNAEARRKAFDKMYTQTVKDYGWPAQIAIGGLTNILQGYNILAGPQVGTPMDEAGSSGAPAGEQITDLSMTDYSQWDAVIAAINTPGSDYYDYWHNSVLPMARRNGLTLDTPFDQTDIEALYNRAIDGIDKEIVLTKRYKDVVPQSELDKLRGARTDMVNAKAYITTLDEAGLYADARTNLNTVLNDKTADPFTQMKAVTDYYNQLGYINTKVGAQNPLFTSSIRGEQAALLGQSPGNSLTIAEGVLATPFASSVPEGTDAALLADHVNQLRNLITLASDGDHVLRQNPADGSWEAPTYSKIAAETGGLFVIVPNKTSTVVLEPQATTGTAAHPDPTAPDPNQGLRPTAQTTPMTVSYGQAFTVMPIIARAPSAIVDPATGRELGNAPTTPRDDNIGMVTYLPDGDGNLTVPIYGIYANGGQLRWTYDNPFNPGTQTQRSMITSDSQALVVTVDQTGLYYIDKNTGQRVMNPVRDAAGNLPDNIVTQYNPQSMISPLKTRPWDPTTFIDPGIAYMSGTDSGRRALAGMSADEVFNSFKASPWVWSNPDNIPEFWQDVASVKAAVAVANDPTNPNARLNSEWTFYNEVERSRGTLGDRNPWAVNINLMQVTALSQANVNNSPTDVYKPPTPAMYPIPTPPGYTLGNDMSEMYRQMLLRNGSLPPGSIGPPAPTPTANTNLVGIGGNTSVYGSPHPGEAGYTPTQQPSITTPTNIKVPGMPTGISPAAVGPHGENAREPNTPFGPRPITPTATPPPMAPLPPAPGPVPDIPGVSQRPRIPHEWDPFGPQTH